jgi:hypothetical protein
LQPTPREPLSTFLERLPKKVLISFAKKYGGGLKGDLSDQEELRSQILEKVPKSVILQQLYAPYGWAGNVTIYLYLFKDIKAELEEVSLRKRLESTLNNINSKQKLTTKPKPVEVILPDNTEIRVRHEFLGEPIIYQDPQTYELKTVNPLMTIFSVVHLPNGFTEIRAREKKNANEAIEQLKEYFHFQGEFEPLSFTQEHLMQWIEWATTLRNARFKPEMEPISTLYMGAKRWYDLRELDMFKEWLKKPGAKLEGIYIRYEGSSEEGVGFGINAKVGKIMFRTFVAEEDIKFIINEAQEILGF